MIAGVFFDRDGTIIRRPNTSVSAEWSDDLLYPNAIDWIRIFNALRYVVLVVSNQSDIGRGKALAEDVARFNREMSEAFRARGAMIDQVLVCPHVETDLCGCRKPRIGLAQSAQKEWNLDLRHSLVFGDSKADEEMATRLGVPFISVENGKIVTPRLHSNQGKK